MSEEQDPFHPSRRGWREKLYIIIFEADTPTGKVFDIALLVAILISVSAVVFESVAEFRARYGTLLRVAEWTFTLLFTVEYLLRLVSVRRPLGYALSFYGIVDLLSILPTYLSIVFSGAHSLLVIRSLRLLRVFRVFKFARYVGELSALSIFLTTSDRPEMERLSIPAGRGFDQFNTIGCAECHIPSLETVSTELPYRFPEVADDPWANEYYRADLTQAPATRIAPDRTEDELNRFHRALVEARKQLVDLRKQLEGKVPEEALAMVAEKEAAIKAGEFTVEINDEEPTSS